MSVYGRTYIARIAPLAYTWREAISVGQEVVERGEAVRESFAPAAFRNTDPASVPVLLGHDDDQVVGKVTGLATSRGWHVAAFQLDASKPRACVAVDYLDAGARLSPGFASVFRDPLLAEDGINWYQRALLREVSILAPGDLAWYVGAKVTSVLEPSKSSSAVRPTTSDRAAGEVVLGPQRIVRHGIGQVLAVGGKPLLRTSSGQAIRREGHDYVIDQPDGSQIIYSGAEGYAEALRDGQVLGVR